MKKILATTAFLALFATFNAEAAPQRYELDASHTNVIWFASHYGFSESSGFFAEKKGFIELDETKPENSKVEVTISTASILTGIPKFDEHLKSADFLNAGKFPEATFVSTKVEKTGEKTAKVTGNLTLLGITKPLSLNVTLNQKGENPFSKKATIGFSATGTIKRSEYGITYGLPGVGDEVKLKIQSEANLAE